MKQIYTYGYSPAEYSKFKTFAWKMLLSFGLTYLFFYNGRQNINEDFFLNTQLPRNDRNQNDGNYRRQ